MAAMLIVYCDKCGARISEGDTQSQVIVGDHSVTYCGACAPAQNARATPPAVAGRPKTAARVHIKPATHVHSADRPIERQAQKSPAVFLIIGAGVLLAGLAVFAMKRKPEPAATKTATVAEDKGSAQVPIKPADAKASNPDSGKAAPVEKPVSGLFGMRPGKDDEDISAAKARVAQRQLNEARQMRARSTHDTPAYRDMLKNIAEKYRDLPEGAEAAKLLAAVQIPMLVEDPNDKRQRIDLLKLVDPARDTVHGNWKMEGGNLGSDKTGLSRCKLPWTAPEEYDLRVKFVRQDGHMDVTMFLMHRGQCVMLMLGGYDNTISGFDKVADKRPIDNVTGVKDSLENKREYTAVVQVRRDGIRAFRDGILISEYRNEFGILTLNDDWNMPPCIAVGSHDSPTTFTSIIAIPNN